MPQRYTSALIVVDMQNDFLARGGYYDEIARRLSENDGTLSSTDIDELAQLHRNPPASCVIRDEYRDLVSRVSDVAAATLEQDMPTIFVRTAYDPASHVRAPLFMAAPGRQDYACHPSTWGAELVDPIGKLAGHRRAKTVEKHTYDAFCETELRGLLRFGRIDTVYVAGVETNVCVLFTALSALSSGFGTAILEDCVATSRPALHEPTLQIVEVAKGKRMGYRNFLRLMPDIGALKEAARSPTS